MCVLICCTIYSTDSIYTAYAFLYTHDHMLQICVGIMTYDRPTPGRGRVDIGDPGSKNSYINPPTRRAWEG